VNPAFGNDRRVVLGNEVVIVEGKYTSVRLKLHHPGSRAATAPGGFKIFDDENIKAG